MTKALADLTIPCTSSFFSGFSRKIFYIQGIRNGIDQAAKINAASNQHLVKTLQQVKSHILRPIWWGTNVSNLTHRFFKGCRNVVQGIISGYFAMVNGMKSALNWISRSRYFNVSAKNKDSQDFNDTSFDFSKKINKLKPLASDTVNKEECPIDCVTELSSFVSDLKPSRDGIFGKKRGVCKPPLAEQVLDAGTSEQSPSSFV